MDGSDRMGTYPWIEIRRTKPHTPEYRAAKEREQLAIVSEQVINALSEIRRLRLVIQIKLAKMLQISQPALSSLEHQDDMTLSTLHSFAEDLGGHLRLLAEFDGELAIPIEFGLPNSEYAASGDP